MPVSHICGTCKQPTKQDKAIKCELCGNLVHAACENLQQSSLKDYKKNKRMHFICIRCDNDNNIINELANVREINAQYTMIDDKLTKLTSRVDTHESLMQALKKKPSDVQTADTESISELVKEEREKYERRLNVCVFNMKHTDDDAIRFSKICSNQLGLSELEIHSSIVNTKRVGHNESSQKPSPLIVSFNSFAVKSNVLKNAYKLKSFLETGSTLKVFISSDLTRKQQTQRKLLRQNLLERRGNGERVFIRRGKIVTSPNNNIPLSDYFPSHTFSTSDTSRNQPIVPQNSNSNVSHPQSHPSTVTQSPHGSYAQAVSYRPMDPTVLQYNKEHVYQPGQPVPQYTQTGAYQAIPHSVPQHTQAGVYHTAPQFLPQYVQAAAYQVFPHPNLQSNQANQPSPLNTPYLAPPTPTPVQPPFSTPTTPTAGSHDQLSTPFSTPSSSPIAEQGAPDPATLSPPTPFCPGPSSLGVRTEPAVGSTVVDSTRRSCRIADRNNVREAQM